MCSRGGGGVLTLSGVGEVDANHLQSIDSVAEFGLQRSRPRRHSTHKGRKTNSGAAVRVYPLPQGIGIAEHVHSDGQVPERIKL